MQKRGCLTSKQNFSYDRGYNEILKTELIERFVEDVLENSRTEAEKLSRNMFADVVELKLTLTKN